VTKQIEIGSKVRSYDFPHTKDFYIEGTVTAINELSERYTILVSKVVVKGDERSFEEGLIVYPPINGLDGLFGGKTDGVELIEDDDLTDKDIEDMAESALNAACYDIQEKLGQTDGGIAGIFFSGPNGDVARKLFADYIRLELNMRKD
jgi:hypothetical protein